MSLAAAFSSGHASYLKNALRFPLIFIFWLCGTISLRAQLIQLSGGSSSLMETQGGTVQLDTD